MKFICLITLFSLCTATTYAKNLDCRIKVDSELKTKNIIQTKQNEKVLAGKTDSTTAYVTEKSENNYTLEAFIPDYEIRIYSEGKIKDSTDNLTLTLWGRETLIEVTCSEFKEND